MVAHRRAGKTVACVADLVLSALVTSKQDARYAYIAPQFNQAKDIAWLYVKRLTHDIPGVTYNEAELRANLPNGAQVRLYGADNPDRLRGMYLDGAILDEHADMKPRVWGEVVRPMLADRKGWAAFIGTPKGHNEFYRVWKDAQSDDWFRLMLKGSESGLIGPEELDAMRKSMTDDQYEQEVECSFEAAIAGAFYGKELSILEREGRFREVKHNPELPVHTAWDLGYRDDTAIWWYQVQYGEVHFLEHHASSGNGIDYYADLVKSKPYKYGKHNLPHDAKAKTLAAMGKSIEEQLASHFGWNNIRIVPDLSVQDGIQAARLMLKRCYFDLGCEEGLECLKQYQREWDEDKKCFREVPRHDWTSHTADAFRMAAVAWREDVKPKSSEETKFPAIADGSVIKSGLTFQQMVDRAKRKRLENE